MWSDDHLESSAFHGLSQVAGVADALDAMQTDIRTDKNGVAESEQGKKDERQDDDREYICHYEQRGSDYAQAFAQS